MTHNIVWLIDLMMLCAAVAIVIISVLHLIIDRKTRRNEPRRMEKDHKRNERAGRASTLPPLHGGYKANPHARMQTRTTLPKPPPGKGGGSK